MIQPEYTLLDTSDDPNFDLESMNLDGGDHLLVVQAVGENGEVSEYSEEVVYTQEHPDYIISKSTLTSIAESVRGKTGKTDPIRTEDIPAEIESILVPTGTKPETITENGEHDVTEYEKVNVDVPVPDGYLIPTGSIDITKNEDGIDVADLASVNVNVPIPDGYIIPSGTTNLTSNTTYDVTKYAKAYVNVKPPLQEKTATSNGTVTPSSGYYGLSKVTVNVPEEALQQLGSKRKFITKIDVSNVVAGYDHYAFPCRVYDMQFAGLAKDGSSLYGLRIINNDCQYYHLYSSSSGWIESETPVIEFALGDITGSIYFPTSAHKWVMANTVPIT